MVHNKLIKYKFQGNREFYSIDLFLAIDIILKILKPYFYEKDSFEIYNRERNSSLELDRVIKQLKIALKKDTHGRKAKGNYGENNTGKDRG